MARYVFVVFTDPVSGQEDAYNDWYTNQHLADVVSVPGYIAAERFEFVPVEGTTQPTHRYLALYTVETNDLPATHNALIRAAGSPALPLSDALDQRVVGMSYFRPLGQAHKVETG